MATATAPPTRTKPPSAASRLRRHLSRIVSRPLARELLILLAFVALTALMTWPWAAHLLNACADPGDPYLHSWEMWWDYHQTFHDPLHLFDGNIFYPLRWTLAFTEDDYGIALLFFPLYALGLRPLTVNSVATFFGFAFCGYGAFRLTRTLTGSTTAAWAAGVTFAFIPYRFHVLSQITYVFAGWMPLLLEALVLFARERSWKRAAWLAAAFTMNALSSLTWMTLSLVPLVLSALVLVVNHRLWRDRAFWVRGAAAAGASLLVLLPFLLPYLYVSKLYNFTWPRELVENNSPSAWRWLVAEYRTKVWNGFGDGIPGPGARFFPGLLPLLLALAAVIVVKPFKRRAGALEEETEDARRSKWVAPLDALVVAALAFVFVASGWANSVSHPVLGRILAGPTYDRAILVAVVALVARLSLAYPEVLRRLTGAANLFENLRESRRGAAFWLASVWAVTGFLMSLGMNSWLYRVLFDNLFIFHSMREPSRAAMVACLGLSVLAGIGAASLARAVARRRARFAAPAFAALVVAGLLFELHAAPMKLTYGAVYPDELTLRLKETPMRGGLVELPTGGGVLPHLYMLRAADHGRPLVNAVSTFVPPHAYEIERLSRESPISPALLDALERVPTSYLVVHNPLIEPERRPVYETFLVAAVRAGRLRFIRRYGEGDDLYAVVKNEPGARAEGPLPFGPAMREWSALLREDPANLVGINTGRSQQLYRLLLAARGEPPRYAEFIRYAEEVGRGVLPTFDDQPVRENLRALAEALTESAQFKSKYGGLGDAEYVERVAANAGLPLGDAERDRLVDDLKTGRETRASVLLKVADDPRVADAEHDRSLVLLHFFAYLRRNPGDPPDRDLSGFDYWMAEVKKHGGEDLYKAFSSSAEYKEKSARPR
jgi:hypothetical protein